MVPMTIAENSEEQWGVGWAVELECMTRKTMERLGQNVAERRVLSILESVTWEKNFEEVYRKQNFTTVC